MSRAVNFTEATYLALHAMALIAGESKEMIPIHAMAERLGVSEAHLAKVIQRLARSGLLNTTRGPGGGVELFKAPEKTTFLEIYEAIEGRLQLAGCVFGKRSCVFQRCVFGDFLVHMAAETENWLKLKTLADFTAAENKPEADGDEKNYQD